MRNLKLYLAEFDPSEGFVAYSIEDESGDRVDKGRFGHASLRNYDPKTMDFFLLSYLPKLMSAGDNLEILGPLSRGLVQKLDSLQDSLIKSRMHPFRNIALTVASDGGIDGRRDYKEEDILHFARVYLNNNDLNETLKSVFEYYREA